jgi:hypothetical protein
MDSQLPAQLMQFLAPSLRRRGKALPLHSERDIEIDHPQWSQRESTTACPFVYSFPIR